MRQAASAKTGSNPRFLVAYRSRQRRNDALLGIVLLIPAVVILAIVVFYPLIQALLLSLTHANLLNIANAKYAGFSNFSKLLHDEVFWTAIRNTLLYVCLSVIGGLVMGMALAIVLNEKIPFRNVFRGLALIPWVVPGVVVALLFLYMFNSQVGIIDWVLLKLHVTHKFMDWYGSTRHALWAEIIGNVWNQTPFYMLMILAGLQTVPQDQHEAATIDGASAVKRFWYVTIPNIRGVLLIVTSLMIIWNFNNFDLIWATTQGGPINATMTLSVYVYRTAFIGQNIGYAAAIGLVWLVVLLLFSTFYIRALKGAEPH